MKCDDERDFHCVEKRESTVAIQLQKMHIIIVIIITNIIIGCDAVNTAKE